ncbi:hypothetical protein ASD90_03500 [Terrabacter sp. Root181]|nr:hypothetical protein ASD90_03500 [Terrabacter sp. Root181]
MTGHPTPLRARQVHHQVRIDIEFSLRLSAAGECDPVAVSSCAVGPGLSAESKVSRELLAGVLGGV